MPISFYLDLRGETKRHISEQRALSLLILQTLAAEAAGGHTIVTTYYPQNEREERIAEDTEKSRYAVETKASHFSCPVYFSTLAQARLAADRFASDKSVFCVRIYEIQENSYSGRVVWDSSEIGRRISDRGNR